MKRLGAILAVVAIAISSQANMVSEGVRELRVQGMIDSGVDINLELGVGYGVFIKDFWEVGGLVGLDMQDGGDLWMIRLGSFAERSFPIESDRWMPFAGGGLGLFSTDMGTGTDFGLEAMGYGGMKYYMQDNLAIGIEGRLVAASEDIYFDGEEYDAFDWKILLSTRFFY